MDRLRSATRRELTFVALATIDVCVIAPLVAALLSAFVPVHPLPVGVSLLGAVLTVHYLARLTLRLPIEDSWRSVLFGLGMVTSGLLTIHRLLYTQTPLWSSAWLRGVFGSLRQESLSRDLGVFLLVLFLWWRGFVLAQRRLDSESVAYRFRLGVVMLAITTTLSGSILPWPYHRFVFAFFFASLLGIALARAEEVGQQYGGSQSPFGLDWLATLVTAGLVILLLAGGFALLLTGENVGLALVPLLQVLRVAVFGLIYVMAWVAQIVIVPLLALLQQYELGRAVEKFARQMTPFEEPDHMGEAPASPFPPEQLALVRTVGIIVVGLLVLLLVALSLRRMRDRPPWQRDEERESVWEGVNLRRGLDTLLRRGRCRLGKAAAALSGSLLGRAFAAMTIRRIYAHVAALAAEKGYPRSPYETPYEYLPTLERAFPENCEDLARVTEAYVAVHYGEAPERPEELQAVRAAWERISSSVGARSGSI